MPGVFAHLIEERKRALTKHRRYLGECRVHHDLVTDLAHPFRHIRFCGDRFDAVTGTDIFVPILIDRLLDADIGISVFGQCVLQSDRCRDSGVVVIEAQHDLFQIRICFEPMKECSLRYRAQRHVGMLLPIVLMDCQKGEHIYRGFEHEEPFALAVIVERILGFAAGDRLLEFADRGPSVEVLRDTVVIESNEDAVVILCVLIEQILSGKI